MKIAAAFVAAKKAFAPALKTSTNPHFRNRYVDLAGCLDALLADAAAGRAWFKVYRQFKMYNDPQLNPQLVKERQSP